MREFLAWAAAWMGGSAVTAFELGRPDLGGIFAALALGALIGCTVLRKGHVL